MNASQQKKAHRQYQFAKFVDRWKWTSGLLSLLLCVATVLIPSCVGAHYWGDLGGGLGLLVGLLFLCLILDLGERGS